jgi:quinol-cytochrome oxidoreductase complex cytochrome b subunit
MKNDSTEIRAWLSERFPIHRIMDHMRSKRVPMHRHSIWYYFGGLTLFFFLIQIVTGILLMLYYQPVPERAYGSVLYIINEVRFGWIIRSVHSWAANLMIATLFIHMISVFLLRAYTSPKEMLWISGILLLGLVLGFGFTGYLLPWDEIAFHATQIGTEIPKSIPLLGNTFMVLLRGGEEIGSATLTRMYALHVVVLPLGTLLLVAFHLFLNQYHGLSKPSSVKPDNPSVPFYPNFLLRDLRAWMIALLALLSIAILYPWSLGPEADALKPAPDGIKPEWYFLPLYQTLKIVPARIWIFNGEALVNIFFLLGGLVLILLPFINRKRKSDRLDRAIRYIGILIILYLVTMMLSAYI